MAYPPKPDNFNNITRAFLAAMNDALDLPEDESSKVIQRAILRAHLMRVERLERWMRESDVEDVDRYDLAALKHLPYVEDQRPFMEE